MARLTTAPAFAAGASPGTWRTYDGTNGLPAGVWSIFMDAQSQLWLGTRAGLVRYDGSNFATFTPQDGLAGDEVMAVCEGDGGLWVGTTNGLSFFDGRSFTNYGVNEGLPGKEIEDLLATPDGDLWIATRSGAARLRDGVINILDTADGLPTNDIRRIYLAPDNRLWLATTGGLVCVDQGLVRHFTRDHGLAANHVLSVLQDRAGRLWVGTLVGLSCHDPNTFEPLEIGVELSTVNVRALHEDSAGRLWIGSIGAGLHRLDGDELTSFGIKEGLLGEHVTCIVEDLEGHLWIGDGLSGLNCHVGQTVEPLTDVAVTEDLRPDAEGRLWFASGNYLCCLADGEVTRARFDVRIFGLLVDHRQRLWVASWGEGLYCFESAEDLAAGRARAYTTADGLGSNNVAGLVLDSEGQIWAGCGHPGALCRLVGERFESVPMPLKVVFRIIESQHGGLWLAGFSSGGLARYCDGQVTSWGVNDGLPSDAVESLCEDRAGKLWLGTRHGLATFDGERFETLGREAGLLTLDNQVAARDSAGQLWFGTKCGIYRWSGEHLQMLSEDDGLPGNAITSLVPEADGAMLVGTYHGIVRYRPTLSQTPQTEVTELVAGQLIRAPRDVELTATEARMVTIAFRGSCLGTHRLRYSYRLVGYDDTWRDTWQTEVRYEELPLGDYRFEVKAISRDLLESPRPAAVQLRVVVDPWREQQAEYEAELGRMQQLLELHQRSTRQNRALVALAQLPPLVQGAVAEATRLLLQGGADNLAVQRAGLWYREADGGWACDQLYRASTKAIEIGGRVSPDNPPFWGNRLEGSRFLAVQDCANDPRCDGSNAAWLNQRGTQSLLVAPIRQAGEVRSALVFEGENPRSWTLDEQQFAASLADLAGQAHQASERRAAELRVSYQARLLEEVSDAIVAVDREQRISSWNQAAEALYGWTPEEAIGQPLDSLLAPQFERTNWAEVWAAVQREGTWRGEARHRNRAGDEREVEWSLSGTTGATGRPNGVVAVIHDITARKEAEREQRQLTEQMQHAQKLESLGVMAGGIAHDFNNLLMGILGNAGLALIELPPESPARQSLEQIELTAQRAAELTRQMLAYSGKGQLEVRPINLTKVVGEMAHLLEVSISKKAVLRFDFDPDVPAVKGDATQLRQVIMNLITNASDALGEAGGTILLRTSLCHADAQMLKQTYLADDLPEGDYVSVEVQDSGCGMDAATVDRIFEPFYTTKFTGRGLGLAAVLGIVRGHGGAIRVDSEPGRGTRFEILLPTTTGVAAETTTSLTPDSSWEGHGTILVIDDERAVLDVVGRSLEQFGFGVYKAVDGIEGLEVYDAHADEIALVVLDLTMPRMDGVETLHELHQRKPDLPVVLSSGYSEQEAVQRFAGEGLAGFLQKPYGPRALVEKVRRSLE